MTDKALHRNTLIFAGIVIVTLILWAYLHDKISAALSSPSAAAPGVTDNGPVSFDIVGQPTVTGPVILPQAVYNIAPVPQNGVYSPSSCECGCSSNSGPTVFNFPDLTGLFNSLQIADNSALTNALNTVTASLPYDEQVYATNNTPTPFA